MSEFKKIPKIDDIETSKKGSISNLLDHINKVEEWRINRIKELEKIKTTLNEILDSELMKQALHFMPRARDRWEGQLSVVEELLEALK